MGTEPEALELIHDPLAIFPELLGLDLLAIRVELSELRESPLLPRAMTLHHSTPPSTAAAL